MADDVTPQCIHFRSCKHSGAPTKESKHGSLLKALTISLVDTYSRCSSEFRYSLQSAPRRVLTKLAKGVHNGGFDNAEHDYICRVGDRIVNPDGQVYEIFERLGQGTFGQVLKCQMSSGNQPGQSVALKVIKNKPEYFAQALVEVKIVQMLNKIFDPLDKRRIVRMMDYFVYRKHLCIAFELLSLNLYDVLKENGFRGVSIYLIRLLTEQLLKAMLCLRDAMVIHCDLKPENVLLDNMQHTQTGYKIRRIKLIDFGSACFEDKTVYPYIQSRFYRSPEVLLGLPYTSAIDMWSLGCICAELYLGLPVFPGQSEYDQVCRIVKILGVPPTHMLDKGGNTKKYFRREEEPNDSGSCDGASGGSASEASVEADAQEGPEGKPEAPMLSGEFNEDPSAGRPEGQLLPHGGQGPGGQRDDLDPQCADQSRLHQPTSPGGAMPTSPKVPTEATVPTAPTASAEATDSVEAMSAPELLAAVEGEHKSDDPRRSSVLDWMKRKLHNTFTEEAGEPLKAAEVQGYLSGMSTTAETSDAAAPHQAPSIDDPAPRDGSSDRSVPYGTSSGRAAQYRSDSNVGSGPAVRSRRSRGRRRTRTCWRLKTREEFEREHTKEPTQKKYRKFNSLEQMIDLIPLNQNLSQRAQQEEQERRACFLQFLTGVLKLNPEERWTPKQASQQSFITGAPYVPDYVPPPDEAMKARVPRLPDDAMGLGAAPFSGGGSARTRKESTGSSSCADEGPSSAPATTRGRPGPGAVPRVPPLMVPPGAFASGGPGSAGPGSAGPGSDSGRSEQESSYRPSLPDWPRMAMEPPRQPGCNGEPYASASSTGSTPSLRLSLRGAEQQLSLVLDAKGNSLGVRPPGGGTTTGTPTSSPHGSAASTAGAISGNVGGFGGSALQGGPAGQSQAAHGAKPNCTAAGGFIRGRTGSRDGSQCASPWHLSSPGSAFSTASDRLNSSQPSGSDSCGHCNFEDSEDPSHSDTPGANCRNSDSDCATPGSLDERGSGSGGAKLPQQARWENIHSEINRGQISRDRRGTQNFREAMGMNESGPVTPFGPGARRKARTEPSVLDGQGSLSGFSPLPRNGSGRSSLPSRIHKARKAHNSSG